MERRSQKLSQHPMQCNVSSRVRWHRCLSKFSIQQYNTNTEPNPKYKLSGLPPKKNQFVQMHFVESFFPQICHLSGSRPVNFERKSVPRESTTMVRGPATCSGPDHVRFLDVHGTRCLRLDRKSQAPCMCEPCCTNLIMIVTVGDAALTMRAHPAWHLIPTKTRRILNDHVSQ
jgi:hypothetical protein